MAAVMRMAMTVMQKPGRHISVNDSRPVANTIALGGVALGNMNASDAAKAAGSMYISGFNRPQERPTEGAGPFAARAASRAGGARALTGSDGSLLPLGAAPSAAGVSMLARLANQELSGVAVRET